MNRINLYDLCELYHNAKKLGSSKDLKDLKPKNRKNVTLDSILPGREALGKLLKSHEFPFSSATRESGNAVEQASWGFYDALLKEEPNEDHIKHILHLGNYLYEQYSDLSKLLIADLREINSYITRDVGLYSTNALLIADERVFPDPAIRGKLSTETLKDIQSAGRSLAFDLHTASGYHICRATERHIKTYMGAVGFKASEIASCKDWKAYANQIRSKKATLKYETIANEIDNIRKHYRNPVIHPDITLDGTEADVLFSICRTIIFTMCCDMP